MNMMVITQCAGSDRPRYASIQVESTPQAANCPTMDDPHQVAMTFGDLNDGDRLKLLALIEDALG